jgi:hypothetical protein
VIVFTDLEDACGGDLCLAVSGLVEAGASLDLVALGERSTPACVTALRPSFVAPPLLHPHPSASGAAGGGSPVVGVAGSAPVSFTPAPRAS